MQTKFFFVLCALQIAQFASAQCGCGPAYVPNCHSGYGPGYYTGYAPGLYHGSLPDNYPESLHYPGTLPGSGYERGDIETAGTLGVGGKVIVDGFLPVAGSVQYGGEVGALGTTSVRCCCGNIRY